MSSWFFIGIAVALSAVAILGDYFLKRAGEGPINGWLFGAGMLVYAACAFGWFYAFRHMKVSTIAGLYGVATVLMLTFMGVVVFNERLTTWEFAGIGMAIGSIALLARFG